MNEVKNDSSPCQEFFFRRNTVFRSICLNNRHPIIINYQESLTSMIKRTAQGVKKNHELSNDCCLIELD